ncbi:hypothetical protein EV424DRAFT_1442471 [Suillus variegatus]|nr:hypothetical protein EV424DRAFT_1442471 [Suillus variegatus]
MTCFRCRSRRRPNVHRGSIWCGALTITPVVHNRTRILIPPSMHFASPSIVPAGITALRNFILILLAIYKYITGRRSPAPTFIGRCNSTRARHHATGQRSCEVSSNFAVSHTLSDTSFK